MISSDATGYSSIIKLHFLQSGPPTLLRIWNLLLVGGWILLVVCKLNQNRIIIKMRIKKKVLVKIKYIKVKVKVQMGSNPKQRVVSNIFQSNCNYHVRDLIKKISSPSPRQSLYPSFNVNSSYEFKAGKELFDQLAIPSHTTIDLQFKNLQNSGNNRIPLIPVAMICIECWNWGTQDSAHLEYSQSSKHYPLWSLSIWDATLILSRHTLVNNPPFAEPPTRDNLESRVGRAWYPSWHSGGSGTSRMKDLFWLHQKAGLKTPSINSLILLLPCCWLLPIPMAVMNTIP